MRFYLLDLLRLFATLQVFTIHYLAIFQFPFPYSLLLHGYLGICIFFSISAFLLFNKISSSYTCLVTTPGYLNKKMLFKFSLNLVANRFSRLFPEYFLCALISFFFYRYPVDTLMNLPQNVFFGIFLHQSQLYNPVSWTLQFEIIHIIAVAISFAFIGATGFFTYMQSFPSPLGAYLISFIVCSILPVIATFSTSNLFPTGELWLMFILGPLAIPLLLTLWSRLTSYHILSASIAAYCRAFLRWTSEIAFSFYLIHYIILEYCKFIDVRSYLFCLLLSVLTAVGLRFAIRHSAVLAKCL